MNEIRQPEQAGTVDYVDGRTRIYGILGHPIEQVRSPQAITFALRKRGMNALLIPVQITPADFDDVFPNLIKISNLDGLIITVPHKLSVMRHLERTGPLAAFGAAASVIARSLDDKWIGEMFDGSGCVSAILQRGVELRGRNTLVLGAGGAGSAIAAAVANENPANLFISDPDEARSATLLSRLTAAFPHLRAKIGLPDLESVDVLINASPVGMLDASRMPIKAERFPPKLAVMDVITEPETTLLLSTAHKSGCVTIYGREMFDSQISAACDFLLGARSKRAQEIDMRRLTRLG